MCQSANCHTIEQMYYQPYVCACACTYAPACMRPPICAHARPPARMRLYAPIRPPASLRTLASACGYLCPPLRVLRVLRVLVCQSLRVLAGAYPTFCKCLTTRSQLASVILSGLCTEILPERTSESTESSSIKDQIFSGLENISEAL